MGSTIVDRTNSKRTKIKKMFRKSEENDGLRRKANKKKLVRDYKKTLCDKGKNRIYEDGIPTDQCEKCQQKMIKAIQKEQRHGKMKARDERAKGRRIAKEAREVHNYI